jgi:hypothetical protein
MPGWEFSMGSAWELFRAFQCGVEVMGSDGSSVTLDYAVAHLEEAASIAEDTGVPLHLREVATELTKLRPKHTQRASEPERTPRRKDEVLAELATIANVAQFVSFRSVKGILKQEYSSVLGYEPNHRFRDLRHAIATLLQHSVDRSINIRSFAQNDSQSRPFIYGLKSVDDAVLNAQKLGEKGLSIIVNETVDIHDGGVSGVVVGNVVEFAPDDTPRAVEKAGVASLPRNLAIQLLTLIYGFVPELEYPSSMRLEFSIHPQRRGSKQSHTLCWELAPVVQADLAPSFVWPNHFSRMIGDKAFGLLIAHLVGLPVPRTTVITRRIAPFSFGRSTGNSEVWIRTCPPEQKPGKYTTAFGWRDPFVLLQSEDPDGSEIASILSQHTISAKYSGAAIVLADNRFLIEGVSGCGDQFMQGHVSPQDLPLKVRRSVEAQYRKIKSIIGPVRFEWVFDGETTWIVQLHRGATESTDSWLVPGNASEWSTFDVSKGLEALRDRISNLPAGTGLLLNGKVGLTSHIADVIRKAGIPARFVKPKSPIPVSGVP